MYFKYDEHTTNCSTAKFTIGGKHFNSTIEYRFKVGSGSVNIKKEPIALAI